MSKIKAGQVWANRGGERVAIHCKTTAIQGFACRALDVPFDTYHVFENGAFGTRNGIDSQFDLVELLEDVEDD